MVLAAWLGAIHRSRPELAAFVHLVAERALDVHALLQTVCLSIVRQPRPAPRTVFGLTGLMKAWPGWPG